MNVETDSVGLVALRAGGRIPEMLGNFHLDDHNVEEWSEATEPGLKHRARTEMGKWIDPDRNADIQYQKREDRKRSETGQEKERTEVISGTAPDSAFQIVRTSRQVEDEAAGRISTMSTSYQMSSSRGTRSTSKTTSNKTTTKTVTVSGSRPDDFETLKMSFTPLDTSTQRERISMGRSGTLGVRRPPTRRHNQPVSSSQVNDEELECSSNVVEEDPSLNGPSDLSIVGYKNLSPKIRVGFPVEIQLELQTKLKAGYLPTGSRAVNGGGDSLEDEDSNKPGRTTTNDLHRSQTEYVGLGAPSNDFNRSQTEYIPVGAPISDFNRLPIDYAGLKAATNDFNGRPTDYSGFGGPVNDFSRLETNSNPLDFGGRRKSYGFESFDSHTKQSAQVSTHSDTLPGQGLEQASKSIRSLFTNSDNISYSETFTPSGLSRSWDLIQNGAGSGGEPSARSSQKRTSTSFTNLLRETAELEEEAGPAEGYRLDSLEPSPWTRTSLVDIGPGESGNPPTESREPSESPPAERSRKLMKMLDESPSILNKVSFRNYLSSDSLSGSKEQADKEWDRSKRTLSFLNDSLSRYLEDSDSEPIVNNNNKNPPMGRETELKFPLPGRRSSHDSSSFLQRTLGILSDNEPFERFSSIYNSSDPEALKATSVSQTWISAADLSKPSQTARDADVTTSISATNDPFRRPLKKVEFCKTEVHFTPESGKFHIVETDENKPSTVHLFRRKKRSERKTVEVLRSEVLDGRSLVKGQEGTETNQQAPTDPITEETLIEPVHRQKGLEEEEEDPPLILSNYGELKIQRYLKQLRSPGSQAGSDSSSESTEPGNAESSFRFDNNFLYEQGSFVPMATRRSLIEMNNRNRKRASNPTTSHVSDNSSTTSNYSLPHSDHSKEYTPLKLTAMEATVATTGSKPKITSVELRYSVDEKERGRPRPFLPEPLLLTSVYDERTQATSGRGSGIPSPVMPSDLRSMPPYRTGRHSFNSSPIHSPPRSPTRDNPSFRLPPKPPTPILPLHFSTFEKTGAALRERFYSKNPKCVCNGTGEEAESSSQAEKTEDMHSFRTSTTIPLKSIVNIGSDGEEAGYFASVLASAKELQNPAEESPPPSHSDPPPWKSSRESVYENEISSPRIPSVARSMTFPKTSRPEPEWVSKAKAKAQSRVTDWTLIGKQYGTNRNSEPPWMSELRIKNRSSPSEELKSSPKVSVVYPWQKEKGIKSEEKVDTPTPAPHPSAPFQEAEVRESQPVTNGHVTPFKSIASESSVTTANNKSIVDLNRDSDSILINPAQIELEPGTPKAERKTQRRLQSASPSSNSVGPKRHGQRGLTGAVDSTRPTTPNQRPPSAASEKGKRSKTPENYIEHQAQYGRKPLQTWSSSNRARSTHASNNSNEADLKGVVGKPKTPPKPPKPPQRISSLVKSQTTTTFNASLEKKKKPVQITRKVINHTNNTELGFDESLDSSPSSTPIHRHPTLQISKLPVRNSSSKPGSPDGKNLDSLRSKTKTQVSLISEAKRLCKPKVLDGSLSSTKTSSHPSRSPSSGGVSLSPMSGRRAQVILPSQQKKR